MCMICVEFQKQRMTTGEARRALGEMIDELDDAHVDEIEEMIADAEDNDSRNGDDPPASDPED